MTEDYASVPDDAQQAGPSMIPAIPTVHPTAMVSFDEIRRQANIAIEAGFLPDTLDTPGKVIAVMLMGRELGLPPMRSVNVLFPVHGRVESDAKTMLSLVYQSGLLEDITFEESDESCTITVKRKGVPSAYTTVWTLVDSKRAGLHTKTSYRKYPRDMNRARVITRACRVLFPDVVGGLYGWEEMAGEPPFGTLPTEIAAAATTGTAEVAAAAAEVTAVGVVTPLKEGPITDWLDFTRAAKALGRSPKEALYLLECADVPEAIAKYGNPQAALDALKEALVGKDFQERRAALLDSIASVYAMDVPVLEQLGVVKYLDERMKQEPDLSIETFDFSELIDAESGELYGIKSTGTEEGLPEKGEDAT